MWTRVCVFQFRTLRILTDCEKQPLAGFNDSSVSARLLMCVFGWETHADQLTWNVFD